MNNEYTVSTSSDRMPEYSTIQWFIIRLSIIGNALFDWKQILYFFPIPVVRGLNLTLFYYISDRVNPSRYD